MYLEHIYFMDLQIRNGFVIKTVCLVPQLTLASGQGRQEPVVYPLLWRVLVRQRLLLRTGKMVHVEFHILCKSLVSDCGGSGTVMPSARNNCNRAKYLTID